MVEFIAVVFWEVVGNVNASRVNFRGSCIDTSLAGSKGRNKIEEREEIAWKHLES